MELQKSKQLKKKKERMNKRMNSKQFRTRTNYIAKENAGTENAWGIGLDIGYSGVKGFVPNGVFCFPSYAKKITQTMFNAEPNENDIWLQDNTTGELWLVGASAQNMISTADSTDTEESLYGRNRYYDSMFKIISTAGLGLSMLSNQYGTPKGKEIYLQTGLPPKYWKEDSEYLKDVLSGTYDFKIRVGKNEWQELKFEIPEERIDVMYQPMGTLKSICVNNEGKLIKEAKEYMKKNILIFDVGFGTLDIFHLEGGALQPTQTLSDFGMKAILSRTSDEIYKKHKTEIPVPAMQKVLEEGTIKVFSKKNMSISTVTFDDILEEKSREVFEEAMTKTKNIFNYFIDIDYLVVTGGTGAAWNNYILDHLKNMKTLSIVPGNKNAEDLPYLYANARGYYFRLLSQLNKK